MEKTEAGNNLCPQMCILCKPNPNKTTTKDPKPTTKPQNQKVTQNPVLREFITGPVFMGPLDITLQLICKQ